MQAGEAAAASEAPSALDVENKAILVALNEADQYYQEQQRFGKTIRKGFLDLAKARQAVGPSNAISALNVREELSTQFSVDEDDAFGGLDAFAIEAASAYRARKGGLGAGSRVPSSESLRRRGDVGATVERGDSGSMTTCEEDKPEAPKDTVLLFAGMPPPALRKAKKEFVAALQHALKLANAARRIQRAVDIVEHPDGRPPPPPTP